MSSTESQVVPQRGNASHQNGSGQAIETQPEQNEQQQQPQQSSVWSILKGLVFRFMVIYFISSLFRRSPQPTNTTAGPMTGSKPSSNLYENGTLMDLYLYISEREFEPNFKDPKELVWLQKDLVYGLWTGGPEGDGSYKHEITIPTSKEVQNNGSLWAHVYVVKSNNLPYHSDQYSEVYTMHKRKRLNRYKKRKYKNTHNLLTGQTKNSAETLKKLENNVTEDIISHWHPNLTINIINDHTAWVRGHVPQPLDEFIEFEPRTGKYWPIIYINDYWNLQRDYTPINDTVKSLPLYVTFHPLSMFRFQLYTAQAMNSRWASMLGTQTEESEEEQDFVKEAFLETSPILLALTVIVSITHSVFEFLAFKNDIQFWKNRSSLEGLSVRSVFFNLFQSVIVLLYVLDNDTNTLIKISIGIGLLIEMWKIHKVVNIQVNREQRMFFGLLPKIVVSDKGSYVESSTKVYDHLAFRYLSWLCFPLLLGYAVYSLLYLEHKGLYSWILSMLYGFLLTFGFIMMTPQLFINYKLKSVAHLPWRMLTYKFLNTFIDDIFAFVIKMPTLYRLGCFRDDIIFLIYLYQRWIYRVDPKRVNEFGVSGEELNNPNAVENSEQVSDTATKKEQ